MISLVTQLSAEQRRQLLELLTQEQAGPEDDAAITAEIAVTLRLHLNVKDSTDLAEAFRRRMVKTAEELTDGRPAGYYDFRNDREIATELITEVSRQAGVLAEGATDDESLTDFAKTFRTMPQARRAAWLRDASLAASIALEGEPNPDEATEAAKAKASATDTASRIARDVAVTGAAAGAAGAMASSGAALGGGAAAAPVLAAGGLGAAGGLAALATVAGPIGLVAGGTVAYRIRKRRKAELARNGAVAAKKAEDAGDVQVRRDRQATQAVVTTCAFLLALT